MPDFMKIDVNPSNWGIFRMMERIEEISERFGPKIPQIDRTSNDFRAELQKNVSSNNDVISESALNKKSAENATTDADELFAPGTFPNADMAAPKEIRFDKMISDASGKYNLDPDLLRAVIRYESNYNPNAVSSKGAMGLMQLMPGTAKDLGVTNAFDPAQNIDGGARYLRSMLDRFDGDYEKAVSAYNAGPKAVETFGGVPPYDETQSYVKRIMTMLKKQSGS